MSELLTASLSTFHAPVYNNLKTSLSAGIAIGTATIPVLSTSNFPSAGVISIGTEVITYTGKTSNTFTGASRGADGTSAAAYSQGAVVELRWVAAHHNSISNEIIKIEGVLGTSISIGSDAVAGSQSYDNVDARISTFEDQKGTITPPPVTGRFGAKYYDSAGENWYIYNGSTWDIITAMTLTPSSDDWDLIEIPGNTYGLGVQFLTPKLAPFVNSAYGALLMTGTLSSQLNSISGFGALGRDDTRLSYKTPDAKMVPVVESDRIAQPYLMSFNIDNPVLNQASVFSVIPDSNRNIRKLYAVAIGDPTEYAEAAIYKLTPPAAYSAAVMIATIGVSTVNSVTPAFTSLSLGSWNGTAYSVSAGDLVYARISSVSGAPGRITVTVEAPYYVA